MVCSFISRNQELELGIVLTNHGLGPIEFRGNATGIYITFVVDKIMAIYGRCQRT